MAQAVDPKFTRALIRYFLIEEVALYEDFKCRTPCPAQDSAEQRTPGSPDSHERKDRSS